MKIKKLIFIGVYLAGQVLALGAEKEIKVTKAYVIKSKSSYGRTAIHSDQIEYELIKNSFVAPIPGKEREWKEIKADDKGWFSHKDLRRGYLYKEIKADKEAIMLLEAAGHSFCYVNGVPRGGDVYSYGWIQHPVKLKKGKNRLLFRVSRGRVRVNLTTPDRMVLFTKKDMTLPDLLIGSKEPAWGAIRVINCTDEPIRGLSIVCRINGKGLETKTPLITRMICRKVGFRIPACVSKIAEKIKVNLTLKVGEKLLDSAEFEVHSRLPQDRHKTTFISRIDNSVQYYSTTPGKIQGDQKPALFLSLHGASVEAVNQANSYGPKDWGHVAAPTNRRPFGFDWEDWGRLDAMEVLDLVEKRFDTDPHRTYLTGHSMGGHGTWQVGVTYPSRFAAIGPSAGWYSFWSYGGKKRLEDMTPIQEMIARACNPSDTLALKRNFLHYGVYVLHGDRDDNVPVTQARFMRKVLAEFHGDFAYYERPGAGHWWGGQCCDWPPMFDFFKRHIKPSNKQAGAVEFITANPGISSQSRWIAVLSQIKPLDFSSVKIQRDSKKKTYTGETNNVACLSIDMEEAGSYNVILDKQSPIGVDGPGRFWFVYEKGNWRLGEKPELSQKGPHRNGTFKDAFRNGMVMVYATQGSEWAYNKARYDAESFWYRGNGSIDIVADRDFDPREQKDRNVILIGNRDTNCAWNGLLGDSPIQVEKDRIIVGDKTYKGEDLGCYFIRPRPGSDIASVGVIAGTGLEGEKSADANTYFISGSGFPDFIIFNSRMIKDLYEGVLGAGYFGNDWSLEKGDKVL